MRLHDYFERYLPAIDDEMRRVVSPPSDAALDVFYGMLHYHLGWVDDQFRAAQSDSGKRIRPVLALLTCEAAGGDWECALPAAASIELLLNIVDYNGRGEPRPFFWALSPRPAS